MTAVPSKKESLLHLTAMSPAKNDLPETDETESRSWRIPNSFSLQTAPRWNSVTLNPLPIIPARFFFSLIRSP